MLGLALARTTFPTSSARGSSRSRTTSSTSAPICPCPWTDERERLRVTAGAGRAARGALRPGQRAARAAEELRAPRRHGGGRAAPRGPGRLPPRRARRRRARRRRRTRNPDALAYLNRLSDLLFILARAARSGEEPLWRPGELALAAAGVVRRRRARAAPSGSCSEACACRRSFSRRAARRRRPGRTSPSAPSSALTGGHRARSGRARDWRIAAWMTPPSVRRRPSSAGTSAARVPRRCSSGASRPRSSGTGSQLLFELAGGPGPQPRLAPSSRARSSA